MCASPKVPPPCREHSRLSNSSSEESLQSPEPAGTELPPHYLLLSPGPRQRSGMFLSCQGLQFQQMLSRNPCPALFLLWGVSPRISPQLLNSSQTGAGFDFFTPCSWRGH